MFYSKKKKSYGLFQKRKKKVILYVLFHKKKKKSYFYSKKRSYFNLLFFWFDVWLVCNCSISCMQHIIRATFEELRDLIFLLISFLFGCNKNEVLCNFQYAFLAYCSNIVQLHFGVIKMKFYVIRNIIGAFSIHSNLKR
jgi:hypothetical protein